MYWWNVSKLAEDLREGRVDEKERFKYFIAAFVAWNGIVPLFVLSEGVRGLISSSIIAVTVVIGIIVGYFINKSGDDTDFVTRMTCLMWTMTVGLLVLFSAVFFVLTFLISLPSASLGLRPFFETVSRGFAKSWSASFIPFYIAIYSSVKACVYIADIAQATKAGRIFQMATTRLTAGEALLTIFALMSIPLMAILAFSVSYALVESSTIAGVITCSVGGLWILLFVTGFIGTMSRSAGQTRSG